MKKMFSLIPAAALLLLVTGCSGAPAELSMNAESSDTVSISEAESTNSRTNEDPYAGLQLSNIWEKIEADKNCYYSLDEIEKACDLAVIAKVVGEPRQESFYDDSLGIKIMTNTITRTTVEFTEVLKGDKGVGDRVDVYASYGVIDGKLITMDGITPLIEGDEWVLFLSEDDDGEYYQTGVADGRYPTKNVKNNRAFSLSEYPELGVFNEKDFNKKIYNELVEKYDI